MKGVEMLDFPLALFMSEQEKITKFRERKKPFVLHPTPPSSAHFLICLQNGRVSEWSLSEKKVVKNINDKIASFV